MTRKPNRTTVNLIIDALGLLLMLSMLCTGVILRFLLPPGTSGRHGGRGLVLWGLDRHEWGGVHFWLAVGVAALLLFHVALHWSWVCGLWQRWRRSGEERASPGARAVSGLAFLLAVVLLMAGFVWLGAARVEERQGPRLAREASTSTQECGPGSPQGQCSPGTSPKRIFEAKTQAHSGDTGNTDHAVSAETVRGFMTLREVADATGVPIDHLRRSLNLPAATSEHEHLGRLRRQFGFQMHDVRRAVAEYRKLRAGEG